MRRILLIAVLLPALLLPGSRIEQAVAEAAAKEKVSPEVKKLMEQRLGLLKRAVKSLEMEVKTGRGTSETLLKVARRLRKAELALATRPAERIAAHQAYFKLVCAIDDMTVGRHKAGQVAMTEPLVIRAARCSAEIELRQAGGTPPKDVKPAREIEPKPEK